MIHFIMCEGLHFGRIDILIHIAACRLFGKEDRNTEIYCSETGNADTGRFDGQDLIHLAVTKKFLELLPQFADERDIDLMVQKAVDLEYISRFDDAVFHNFLLQ